MLRTCISTLRRSSYDKYGERCGVEIWIRTFIRLIIIILIFTEAICVTTLLCQLRSLNTRPCISYLPVGTGICTVAVSSVFELA